MPYVPDFYRQCVGFIYPNARSAKADARFLGVGFVASISGVIHPLGRSHYFVTCNHIVKAFSGPITVRFNTYMDCGSVTIPKKSFVQIKEHDLAVAPIKLPDGYPIVHIGTETFVKAADILEHRIGAGDDVFMVSRVVRDKIHYRARNVSVLRFGNISLVPQVEERFYLVEMRSIAGHSGSPVLVYSVPNVFGQNREQERDFAPMLLGINRGHLRDYEQIVRLDAGSKKPHPNYFSQTNMAISQVVPSWNIETALHHSRFKRARLEADTLGPVPDIVED